MWTASPAQDVLFLVSLGGTICHCVKCRNLGLLEVKPLPELLTPQWRAVSTMLTSYLHMGQGHLPRQRHSLARVNFSPSSSLAI